MSEGRPDAVNTKLGLLSDAELYQLYLRALGYPMTLLRGRPDQAYDESRTKRLLTSADAILYLLAAIAIRDSIGEWSGLVQMVLCVAGLFSILNVATGFLAIVGRHYFRNLDMRPIEPPPIEAIKLHSPEVLAFISEFLARPLISNAKVMAKQLRGELDLVERFVAQAQRLAASLKLDKDGLTDESLAKSYDSKRLEAEQTMLNLEQKRDSLVERIARIEEEVRPLEQQVEEMRALGKASQNLESLKGMTQGYGSSSNVDGAIESFSELRARVEMARQNLEGAGMSMYAYEQALEEMKRLTLNSES